MQYKHKLYNVAVYLSYLTSDRKKINLMFIYQIRFKGEPLGLTEIVIWFILGYISISVYMRKSIFYFSEESNMDFNPRF